MGRIATGLTAAGLSLTAAVFVQDCAGLAAFFVVVTVVILVGTVAHLLPGLHRVPLIGSAQLSVAFDVEGSVDQQVRISERPISAILVIGVSSPQHHDIDGLVTVLASPSLNASPCDDEGRPVEVWTRNPPTAELAEGGRRTPYWTHEHRLRGGVWNHFRFRISPEREGEFPVRVKVSSSALYRSEFVSTGHVRVIKRGSELTDWDRISDAIQAGEELRLRLQSYETLKFHGLNPEQEYVGWAWSAGDAVPEALREVIDPIEPAHSGLEYGQEWLLSRVDKRLSGLYEARRRL